MPLPCLILKPENPSFRIVEVNDTYLKYSASNRKDYVGKLLDEAFPENLVPEFNTSLQNVVSSFQKNNVDSTYCNFPLNKSQETSEYYWHVENAPLINKKGNVVYILHTVHDNSRQVLAEKNEREVRKELIKARQKEQEIAWEQSHLVRAPLARLKGLLQLLKQEESQEMCKEEILRHIDTSAEELDKVVKEIIAKTERK